MNVVVILSDDEAENVASILRRMNERVEDADDTRVAYVDDRGPTDFANQLEALVDAGDPSIYVPVDDGPTTGIGYVTRTTAHTAAAKTGRRKVHEVPIADPKGGEPDE